MARTARGYKIVERRKGAVQEPTGFIDTRDQSRKAQVEQFTGGDGQGRPGEGSKRTIDRLIELASHNGNLCDILGEGEVSRIGQAAIREWTLDGSTSMAWKDEAKESLDEAAQEDENAGQPGTGKDTPWEDSSNVNYPILTQASMSWHAKAYPELVKGDEVIKVKSFAPSAPQPSPGQMIEANPAASPEGQQAQAQLAGQAAQADLQRKSDAEEKEACAKRQAKYLNHVIFYEMDNWEGETDLLLCQMPIIGQGFKKVYMSPHGVQSDFVSALDFTVDHDTTKNLVRVPRQTQEFFKYPYEIEELMAKGQWRDVVLMPTGQDPEAPREMIEQLRNEDLDGDGVAEPYIVTVDVQTQTTLAITAAYTLDDVFIDETKKPPRVLRFDRWAMYADFKFLPDPRGRFYGMGFGRLLRTISAAVDTSVNQMMDATTAANAGGGFIGAGVRLQGGGQGGSLYFKPGEYQIVNTPGPDIRQAIYERTFPTVSPTTMTLLQPGIVSAARRGGSDEKPDGLPAWRRNDRPDQRR